MYETVCVQREIEDVVPDHNLNKGAPDDSSQAQICLAGYMEVDYERDQFYGGKWDHDD